MSCADDMAPYPTAAEAQIGFAFTPTPQGWRWTVYDRIGRVTAEGTAPAKAIAAACVIRELARA